MTTSNTSKTQSTSESATQSESTKTAQSAMQVQIPALPQSMLDLEHTFVKSDFYLQTSHKVFQSEHLHDYVRVELINGTQVFAFLVALVYDFTSESAIPYVYVVDSRSMRFIPKCIALNMSNVAGIYSRRKKSDRKAKSAESTMSADDLLGMLS